METNKTRVMLTKVRLAFPVLNKPEQFQGEGKPRYSGALIIEGTAGPQIDACLAAMRAAAAAKWGEAKADTAVKSLRAALKTALTDGSLKANYDGFDGNTIVSAHAQEANPPRLLDGQKKELPRDTGVIYAGCYVNASVEFWAQDNKWGKRINAQLRGVQFHSAGDSFGAGSAADPDEFDTVEGAPEDAAVDADFA